MHFILVNDRWKYPVTNAFTLHDFACLIQVRSFSFRNPRQEQLIDFNQGVTNQLWQHGCNSPKVRLGIEEDNAALTYIISRLQSHKAPSAAEIGIRMSLHMVPA